MGTDIETEAREAYTRYVETRRRAMAGEVPWSALADFFTDDAVFIDPAWGRVEGRDGIEEFMDESMAGLEGWDFPEVWTMVDGRRLVTMWDQVLPPDESGERRRQPGLSVMYYAGRRQVRVRDGPAQHAARARRPVGLGLASG